MCRTMLTDRSLVQALYIWSSLIILVHILPCLCVNIHLHEFQKPGSVIFNASLPKSRGIQWFYSLDSYSASKEIVSLLTLDSKTGVLSQTRTLNCREVTVNPFYFVIISESYNDNHHNTAITNSTHLPLLVYLHGRECPVPKHRKTKRWRHFHDHRITLKFSRTPRCFKKHESVLSVIKYLPSTLINCKHLLKFVNFPNFKYHKESGYIINNEQFCVLGDEWSLSAILLTKCYKLDPVKIPVLFEFHTSFKGVSQVNHFVEVHSKQQHIRLKRQTAEPSFPQTQYTSSVAEKQNPGVHVITITANDADSGPAGTLTYSMTALNDQRSKDMFAINPTTGAVNTTVMLDRELIQEHNFHILATDNGLPPLSAQTTLIITVEDVNDNDPVFEQNVYYTNISESTAISSTVLRVKANDNDEGPNREIRYSIINSLSPNDAFAIADPMRGSITTRAELDREKIASYQLLIQAMDQGQVGSRRSSTATVNFRILDENDNYPQFSQKTYHVNISEDYESDPVILTITATDADEGSNKDITYDIFGGNTLDTFSINRLTGALSLERSLDHETNADYHLLVRAQDGGQPPRTNSTTVIVDVIDVNDNVPSFYTDLYKGTISEGSPINTTVLTVQAHDPDSGRNGKLAYSIIGAPADLPFYIDHLLGEVKIKHDLDRETREVYEFTVKAQDNGTTILSTTTQVQVTVRDINDNSPEFSQSVYNISVREDTAVTTRILSITAVDADKDDNAYVTYSIQRGNTDNTFKISSDGMISLLRPLNYKTQNQYNLEVRATDSGNNFDTATVQIKVLDTNQNRPSFEGTPYSVNVDEGVPIGSSIYKVFAIDSDVGENGRISYASQSTTDFDIDSNTGEISTRIELDRELTPYYSFYVTARDHGQPSMTATTIVTVTVNDVNDNKPEFSEDFYVGTIKENAQVGKSVMTIYATDRDKNENARITYSMIDTGVAANADFEVDSLSGIIRVQKPLDRETTATYYLSVMAVDGGVTPQSTSVTVTINVEDVNDNPPVFQSDEIEIYVPENTQIGSTIAQISATDPDEGENAQIEYEKIPGMDADSFDLSYRPGGPAVLKNRVELNYESDKKVYYVRIKANSTPFFKNALLVIKVQDVNDNEPILKDFTIIFNNFVGKFITGPIGRVPASDPDEMDRDKLRYEIVAGNDASFIQLNQTNGEITLDYRLNSDIPRNGTIQLKVSDGKNEKKATCKLYVRLVTDEMLQNSVTIRLNNMTQVAFLSPLFTFFQGAVATIMKTENKNIYITNIENDTDVNAQILNVSISVQRPDGSFYSVEYLQEQIYLQRILLANISTLQVLPFDDNLCVIEPCPNFAVCKSSLKFGSAMPFIYSDMMLFRPIHPVSSYGCKCPNGFTGGEADYLCDVEIDMCYSSPCKHNGTCVRKEGGYTCLCNHNFVGTHCEISNLTRYDALTCPQHICKPHSTCEALPSNGFWCKGCPNEPYFNKFCQLTTRQFPKGSFLTFPALKKRHRFTIKLQFSTQVRNGLLLYNGRFNEKHDFIALEIINGQLQFSFSLGSNITSIVSNVEGGVSNGEWHHVTVKYLNKTVTLTVGEDCDTEIVVRYGHLISDYSCAARVTQTLPDRCYVSTEICHRLLDLTGPLQIGGLPKLPSTFQIQNKDFEGCIKDVYIDDELLDLNQSVADVGTIQGCAPKQSYCLSAPCKNAGTCVDVWGTYFCRCPERTGGKDCSQVIDDPVRLEGDGYLLYSDTSLTSSVIYLPWYNGISFRTRATEGVLMHIIISDGHSVTLELLDGYARYNYTVNDGPAQVYHFNYLPVNDGQWHYLEIRWMKEGQLILVMDYGHYQTVEQIQAAIESLVIQRVYIGAMRIGNGPISKGFVGCVENIRVGNTPTSLLQNPSSFNIFTGCDNTPDLCLNNPCPTGATCISQWKNYQCKCPAGTLGPECRDICQTYNPCLNWATCHGPTYGTGSDAGYTCECGNLQSGRYCQNVAEQPCPAAWYGYPVCGPCNCSRDLGFNPSCNKSDGTCYCKENFYRPAGSDRCYPCDCYPYGSTSLTCHPVSGQCLCKANIVGRQCQQCESEYAHISLNPDNEGCLVVKNMCPRHFYMDVWWDAQFFGHTAVQDCPFGAVGDAKRRCTQSDVWSEPDLFNCTNRAFVDILSQIEEIERGELKINTFVANTTMEKLANATVKTEKLFGNDINITYRMVNKLLEYENLQIGLNLTSEQTSFYLQNMLDALSVVFDDKYKHYWTAINQNSGGASELLQKLEKFLVLLTENLETLQKTPYSVVSKNIVLTLDTFNPQNFSGAKIPKFDNIVQRSFFDDDTYVKLPQSIISQELSAADYINQVMTNIGTSRAYVSYMMFNTLGALLPNHYDEDVRVISGRPVTTNSPLFSLVVRDQQNVVTGGLSQPLKFHFKQQIITNRTSPQCAFWDTSDGSTGKWSTRGCSMERRFEVEIIQPYGDEDSQVTRQMYVVCSCNHMTTFALLMDVADSEYIARGVVSLPLFCFIGISISMACLFVTFMIFLLFKHLQCNATSIMLNLIFTIFMAELAFITGVNRPSIKLVCRIVAIGLHFFFMSAFAWLFVEMLHLYRRLSEIREINYGAMKFYYLLGYVLPGIVAGLSVGLYTDGYGNDSFCWLDVSEAFIWSFAGPVAFTVPAIIFMFVLALHASCKEKVNVSDIVSFRTRIFSGVILLLLLSVSWILGLLSVNYDLSSLYYVFAAFAFCTGLFIFLAYVVGDKKVRFLLKKQWYKMQGKKLEANESLVGSRPSVSRSALAYRRDSSTIDGYINRTNVGISTTSTTSRSTSKSSGGLYKGEDYLRSTDTSTSGHVPSYEYDNAYRENVTNDPEEGDNRNKSRRDSDSESDISVGRASLDLASSHSSDEDDEFEIGTSWEKQLPKNKKIEEAKEQVRKKKQEKLELERQQNLHNLQHIQSDLPPSYTSLGSSNYHWPGDPNLSNLHMSESDYRQSDQYTMSSVPPDVTLPAQELQGHREYIIPPIRKNSLLNDSGSISNNGDPFSIPTESRMKVQVLTHNGSISSDSECSNETTV